MKAIVLFACALAGCAGSAGSAGRSHDSPPRCVDARDANELQGTVLRRNEHRYEAALASKGLIRITLPMHQFQVELAQPIPKTATSEGHVEEREIGGKRARFIMWGQMVPNCAWQAPEFVHNGSKVFSVERRPRVTKQSTIIACGGCVPGPDFPCGGAVMAPEAVGFALADGSTYDGSIAIEYDVESVDIKVPGSKPCPAQAPPP